MGTPRGPGSPGSSGGPTNVTAPQGGPGSGIFGPNGEMNGGVQLWGPTKNTKPPPDFRAAAEETAAANRPNQTNAYGSTTQWTIGPDGRPQQTQSFGGALGGASTSLQNQAAGALSSPFDLSGLPQVGSGDEARQQAISSAYQQSTSRLDPRFAREEDALRTRLLNQGLDPNSEASQGAMGDFGQQKNDAYQSAMASAISQGQSAGDSVFRNNLAGHGSALADLLTGRGQALSELQQMQGLLAQPGFNSGPNYSNALSQQTTYDQDQLDRNREQMNDSLGGIMDLLGSLGKFIP